MVTSVLGLSAALVIVVLIRRDHLHVRYGLWWMTAAIGFALLGLFPTFFDRFSHYLGVAYPPILAVAIAIILLVIKILVMDIERSRNVIRLQRLTQRVALLEADLRETQGKSREPEDGSSHGEIDDEKS